MRTLVLAVLVLAATACTLAVERRPSSAERLSSFSAIAKGDNSLDDKIGALREQFVGIAELNQAEQLVALEDATLRALFEANYFMCFYESSLECVDGMRLSLAEIEVRKLSQPSDFEWMYTAFLDARIFEEANALALKKRVDAPIFKFDSSAGQSTKRGKVWALSGSDLHHRNVDLRETSLLVVAGPGCHFSRRAALALWNDPELRAFLSENAVWISPVDGLGTPSALRDWNAQFPDFELVVADNVHDWPGIELREVPGFYLLEHGKVAAALMGWPSDERVDQLRALIRTQKARGSKRD